MNEFIACSFSDVPVIFVIILVIGCIVLVAIIGLLCMCLCKYQQYSCNISNTKQHLTSRHTVSEKEIGNAEMQDSGG